MTVTTLKGIGMQTVLASAGTSAGGIIGVVLLAWVAFVAYWVPTMVAWRRHVPNIGSVAVINGFAGWTLAGWVVALAMACRSLPPKAAVPPKAAAS